MAPTGIAGTKRYPVGGMASTLHNSSPEGFADQPSSALHIVHKRSVLLNFIPEITDADADDADVHAHAGTLSAWQDFNADHGWIV